MLTGVQGRDGVELHVGNTIADSHGCLLIGREFGKMTDGTPGILRSTEAFKDFMFKMSTVDEFMLTITDGPF